MNRIAKTKTRMTAEHDTRLPKVGAESFRIDVLEMLQSGVFHKTYKCRVVTQERNARRY